MAPNVLELLRKVGHIASANSPTVLTGLAIGGLVTTVGFTVDGTIKAVRAVDEERDLREKDAVVEGYDQAVPLSKGDIFHLVWKSYIPAVGMGLGTIVCIVCVNKIHLRRNAALVGLYEFTEGAFKEYRSKVVETLGAKKEMEVRDAVAQDRVTSNPPDQAGVVVTVAGNTKCFEPFSGRYFTSDVSRILAAVNSFNNRLLKDMYRPINEWFDEIGLDPVQAGENLGWSWEYGMLEVRFSSTLDKENNPVLVLEYKNGPRSI